MSLASARQRLQRRREQFEASAKKSLGQNFLVSDLVIHKILTQTQLAKPQTLLEIGPGLGALTDGLRLLPSKQFLLLELDSRFASYWKSEGCEVEEVDALRWDWSKFLESSPRPLALVSNLPYQISSSLVIERCLDQNPLDVMILMFQKEVAERLRAQVGQEAYGFLSVMAQLHWRISIVVDASPRDFDPPPRIASRVLLLTRKTIQHDPHRLLKLLKAAFLHPRKKMISNLTEGLGRPKDFFAGCFQRLQWVETLRSDQLSPEQFLALFEQIEQD